MVRKKTFAIKNKTKIIKRIMRMNNRRTMVKLLAAVLWLSTASIMTTNAFVVSASGVFLKSKPATHITQNPALSVSPCGGSKCHHLDNVFHRNSFNKNQQISTINKSSKLSMSFNSDGIDGVLWDTMTYWGTHTEHAGSYLSTFSKSVSGLMAMSSDPDIEVEVLNNMAHLTLDMAVFLVPDTVALRLFAVIGRLLAIGVDYVPDHTILGEELVFQLIMLGIAAKGLYYSLVPRVTSFFATTSQRDIRTYLVLFRDSGLTWCQYRTMKAVTFDWIEVEPSHIITSDETLFQNNQYIYWLYKGEVHVHSEDKHLHTVTQDFAPRTLNPMTILGEMDYARSLDKRDNIRLKKKKNTSCIVGGSIAGRSESPLFAKTTIEAGPFGATLLRIDTAKLTILMNYDAQMAQCVRCLLMIEMQEKLMHYLAKSNPDDDDTNSISTQRKL